MYLPYVFTSTYMHVFLVQFKRGYLKKETKLEVPRKKNYMQECNNAI